MQTATVEIKNLTKVFPSGAFFRNNKRENYIRALDGVHLAVQKGEIFGILGPNRAGKTTLLKILSTLVLPTEGEVCVCGYDVVREGINVQHSIGVHLGEDRGLYWRLTGKENLEFFASLYGMCSRKIRERLKKLCEVLGIDTLDSRVNSCSSGAKQKLLLARALLHDPQVLLLDEPTKSIDLRTANDLRQFLRKKCADESGKTILLVTHNVNEAKEICDRVAILNRGKITTVQHITESRSQNDTDYLEKMLIEAA